MFMFMSTLTWVNDPHSYLVFKCFIIIGIDTLYAFHFVPDITLLIAILWPLIPWCLASQITFSTMGFGVPNPIVWYLILVDHFLCLVWFPFQLGFVIISYAPFSFSFLSEDSYLMEHTGLSCIDFVATWLCLLRTSDSFGASWYDLVIFFRVNVSSIYYHYFFVLVRGSCLDTDG